MKSEEKPSKGRRILEEIKKRKYEILDEKGNIIEVPEKGSLGLLAQGYLVVLAVRKKRDAIKKSKKKQEGKSNEA